MVTRADVARLADVSPAVVSYVLNGGPRPVSTAARERVLRAVDKLQYRPNSIARSLRLQSTSTVGLIVPDTSNPFFAELSRAVEDAVFSRSNILLLGNALGSQERQATYVRAFLDQQVDGLAVIPSGGLANEWLAEIKRAGTPLVVIDRKIPSETASSVMVDNVTAAEAAVRHLVDEHGVSRVGCLSGPPELSSVAGRLTGFRNALAATGREWDDADIVYSEFNRTAAREAAMTLFRQQKLDGLFTTSDEQAIGVLRAASELGIRVPEDLALVSFDGINSGKLTTPRLATAHQPFQQMGEAIAEILLGSHGDPMHFEFEAEFAADESCGCTAPSSETAHR